MRGRVRQSLILFFTLLTAGIFWWSQHPDPGYFQRSFTARTYEQFSTGTLTIDLAHGSPGTAPFLIILSEVTGMSMFEVMYFPIAAVGRGILYIGILWILTRSLWYSGLFGVAMTLYPWAGYSSSTIHVHALGSILFLSVVLLFAAVITRKGGRMTRRDTLLFSTVAITLLFIDYRMVIWALLLFAPFGLLTLRRDGNTQPLLLAGIIGVGYWLKITPYQYIGFLGTRLSSPFEPILNYFSESTTTQPFKYQETTGGLTVSRLFYYFLFSMCLVYGFYRLYQMLSERDITFDDTEVFLSIVLFAGGMSTVFYLLIGRFSQSFLIIGFPLLAAVALYRFPVDSARVKQAIRLCGVGILLFLVVSSFATGVMTDTLDSTSESRAGEAGGYLSSVADEPTVLTDLRTASHFQQQDAIRRTETTYQYYDVDSYRSVVSGGTVSADYVVIDYGTQRGVDTFGWERFENLHGYQESIKSNTNLRRVYSTENISIYHVERA